MQPNLSHEKMFKYATFEFLKSFLTFLTTPSNTSLIFRTLFVGSQPLCFFDFLFSFCISSAKFTSSIGPQTFVFTPFSFDSLLVTTALSIIDLFFLGFPTKLIVFSPIQVNSCVSRSLTFPLTWSLGFLATLNVFGMFYKGLISTD